MENEVNCELVANSPQRQQKIKPVWFLTELHQNISAETLAKPKTDLGWGGGRTLSFSGIRPPANPKSPSFVLFWHKHFWLTDP